MTNSASVLHTADFSQILLEARKRWLRPTEICEILSNYKLFSIAAEPPSRPPSTVPCSVLSYVAPSFLVRHCSFLF